MHASQQPRAQIYERIRPVKSNYEPGMKISYYATSRRLVIAFRGRITVLPEIYEHEDAAIKAGEAHCRQLGWNPEEQGKPKRVFLRSWS